MKKFMNKIKLPTSGQGWVTLILVVGLTVAVICGLGADIANNRTDVKATHLVFSEICTKNESIIADNDGSYRDYVELYNGGNDINLKGYCLTDGQSKSEPFGDMPLPSGTYCVLFLGKEVTGFSLKSSGGECVSLINPKGKVVTQANTLATINDQVMLYTATEYVLSGDATPGFSNDRAGLLAFREGEENESPVLQITEVLTENVSSLPDETGRYSDVVELYNSGNAPIFLRDYCLSDSRDARFRYRLPSVMLQPGNYAVIYCDGENYLGENGEIHANFGLSRGDILCLTDRDGRYTTLPIQFPGQDASLVLDSEGNYKAGSVSLGYANDETGIAAFSESRMETSPDLVVSELLLSSSEVPYQGSVADVVEIWNRSDKTVNMAGWYLSDGADPYTYPLPQQELKPNERMVVRCSRTDTGFALSQRETLCLLTPGGKWASRVSCAFVQPGQSIQLVEENTYTAGAVSLGYENTPSGVLSFEQVRVPQGLQISELMSANLSYIKGAYGKTWDWVELYNGGKEAVNLKDYTFSTDGEELGEHPLPDKTLSPGQYCVILLSDREDSFPYGYSVLPVNLSSQGESVYLSRGGEIVDYAVLPALPTDISYGRGAGDGVFASLSTPTPGGGNAGKAAISATPQAATAQGAYNTGSLDVTITGQGTIYYTTDCTVPTAESTRYTGPIHLTNTTVIRAISCEPGKLPSEVVDLTYLVNEGHSLPVISLVTAPDNLWDYNNGIYVEGPNASPEFPHKGANYWQDWEKPATVSLFETDGTGFSEPCGISIFGAYSRALSMKAFSLAFRDCYGAGTLHYPLFGEKGLDSYESFILRCSGQDVFDARMRDVLMTSLIADHTTVAVQKYRPVVLYLNGEFWGVYYVRERARDNFVAGNYNVSVEDVTITSANGVDKPEYMALISYVQEHDLSKQEYYDYVCSQVDIDNYIDYIVGEMYIANPDNGNIRYFKYTGGKWTWIMYDTDYGFSNANLNTAYEHLNPAGTGSSDAFSTKLINALLRNPDFKEKFIRRIAWQINNIWTQENVNARIDELEGLIAHDMQRDCAKRESSYARWQSHVERLRQFAPERNKQFPKFVQEYFSLTDTQMREYGFAV